MDPIDRELHHGEILERFLLTQEKLEEFIGALDPEDCLLSVTPETSPPKWHLGHTSWFFARFLLQKFSSYEVSPELDHLFNSYYKGVGDHLPKSQRGFISRPGLAEVLEWRGEVRSRVLECLESAGEEHRAEIYRVLELGLNHEEQHLELLLMDIKRNFFANPLRPRYRSRVLAGAQEQRLPTWVNVPSGLVKIGAPRGDDDFHYDNEGDSHLRWIDSFMLMSHPVSNGDFLEFIRAGGYQTHRYWLSDGWDLLQRENWKRPLYWEERDGEWWVFTLWGMVPLDRHAPVCHLSYYEADAYARFRGARLPTEFEWECASLKDDVHGDFLDSGAFEPMIPDDGGFFPGIHGTVWEWTQSAYLPYPRFESFQSDLSEYNGKFMVNQMVLRGGSCVTAPEHYRPTYRNFYYPQNRWQYAGLRLAKDLA